MAGVGKGVVDRYLGGKEFRETSPYGERIHPVTGGKKMHHGLDLGAKAGTNIQSIMGGIVIDSKFDKGGGNIIKVLQDDGTTAVYMHMLKPANFKKGQRVNAGDVIGLVGSTGRSTGAHLHLEFRKDGKSIDPKGYLKKLRYNSSQGREVKGYTGSNLGWNLGSGLGKSAKSYVPATSPIHGWISQANKQYGVKSDLVYAIMKAESNFNTKAKSPVGAYGLMQLMPHFGTGRLDPRQNVMLGTQYIGQLLKQFGDVRLAVASYNAGQGRVGKLLKKHGNSYDAIEKYLPNETRNYVRRVWGNLGYGTAW